MFILLDLDGVCADFVDAACKVHNRSSSDAKTWDWYTDSWGMAGDDFWAPILEMGESFYDSVFPYPWLDRLLDLVSAYGDVVIATTCPTHVSHTAGKLNWIKRHMGCMKAITGPPGTLGPYESWKSLLARSNHVLIDDCEVNVDSFRRYGGRSILFPRPWNRLRRIKPHLLLDFVESALYYH